MCAPANNTGGRGGGDDGQSRARPSRLSSVTSGEAHVTAAAAHRPPFAIDAHRAKRSYRSEACPPQRFSPTNMLTIEQIVVSVLLMLSLLAANIEAGQHAKQVSRFYIFFSFLHVHQLGVLYYYYHHYHCNLAPLQATLFVFA